MVEQNRSPGFETGKRAYQKRCPEDNRFRIFNFIIKLQDFPHSRGHTALHAILETDGSQLRS